MTSARIADYINANQFDEPCLIVDTDIVRENYLSYAHALPDTRIFYTVKANPSPQILSLLVGLGSSFDCASMQEIEMALAAGATPDRISFGNTIKKERDIARAFNAGIRLFAVNAVAEVEKVARAAPGARVFCRILCDGEGAEWPLSRKFGCATTMAPHVLGTARDLGLKPYGVFFRVGSQQTNLAAWDKALAEAAWVFDAMAQQKVYLQMVNLGGGFPTRYLCDALYAKNHYPVPLTLTVGDEILIEGTGAYTTTYSAQAFNGFPLLRSVIL